jgi:cytochrome c oxidase subunit 4
LLILTVITVTVSRFDFGAMNIYVAMAVAVVKAMLVILIFMGMKWDTGFIRIIFVFTVIFMGIFMAFTLADINSRGDVDMIQNGVHNIQSPVKPMTTHEASSEHH